MTGELDISVLVSSMQPVLDADEYVFCSVKEDARIKVSSTPILEFREKEGITLILRRLDADREKLNFVYPCRLITLNIHSNLEAVGFLAAITKHLASAGISVNAVSAYFHDHIFVPYEKAELALTLLKELSIKQNELDHNDLTPDASVLNSKKSIEY